MHFWLFFSKNFNLSRIDELLSKNKEASNFLGLFKKNVTHKPKNLLIIMVFIYVIPHNNFSSRYKCCQNARALNVHFPFTHFD